MTYLNRNANDPLRSRREAANYLGVAPQTLAVWACTKRYHLPLIKIGRHVKYRQSDLDAFIERNTYGGEELQ
jgi:excisionase family DNA binding protein